MGTSLLRLNAVKARTGLSRSSIYLFIANGTFPKQVSLGARAVGWVESEISSWIESRIQESRPDIAAPSLRAPPEIRQLRRGNFQT